MREIGVNLNHLDDMKKSQVKETEVELESLNEEIRHLRKILEQLEFQKLGLEQKFIEQTYLNDDFYHQNLAGLNTLLISKQSDFNTSINEDLANTLNSKGERVAIQDSKLDNKVRKDSEWNNIEISPIKKKADPNLIIKEKPMNNDNKVPHIPPEFNQMFRHTKNDQPPHNNNFDLITKPQFVRKAGSKNSERNLSTSNGQHNQYDTANPQINQENFRAYYTSLKDDSNSFNENTSKTSNIDDSIKEYPSLQHIDESQMDIPNDFARFKRRDNCLNLPLQNQKINQQHYYQSSNENSNRNNFLNTIHEEQSTWRDSNRGFPNTHFLRSQFLFNNHANHRNGTDDRYAQGYESVYQNSTVKKNLSKDRFNNSYKNDSMIDSYDLGAKEYKSNSLYYTLDKSQNTQNYQSCAAEKRARPRSNIAKEAVYYKPQPLQNMTYNPRSRSLGTKNNNASSSSRNQHQRSQNKSNATSSLVNDGANYSSVPKEKQNNTFIRRLQANTSETKPFDTAKYKSNERSIQDLYILDTVNINILHLLSYLDQSSE